MRIHKHERQNASFKVGFAASSDNEKEEEVNTLKQGAKRTPSKIDKYIEYGRALVSEYNRTAALITIASNKENTRLARVRKSRDRSKEEAARFDTIERMSLAREEADKWLMHDDYDRMIDTIVSLTTKYTKKIPIIGERQRIQMTYAKRQLSLLRLKKRLALLSRDTAILEEAFELDEKIRDETDRFIHSWIIGDDVLDYETNKRYLQNERRKAYTEYFIDIHWDGIIEKVATNVTDYVKEKSEWINLEDVDYDHLRDIQQTQTDCTCATFIAMYDGVVKSKYENGEISEEVWHNSTAFFKNTYTALRERSIRLIDALIKSTKGKSMSFGGKLGVDDEEDGDEDDILRRHAAKNLEDDSLLGQLTAKIADWSTIIGIGGTIIIVFIITMVMSSLSGIMFNVTTPVVQPTNNENKSVTLYAEDGSVVPRESVDRSIAKCFGEMTTSQMEACIADKEKAMGTAIGSMRGQISSYGATKIANSKIGDVSGVMGNFRKTVQTGPSAVKLIIDDALNELKELAIEDVPVQKLLSMTVSDIYNDEALKPQSAGIIAYKNIIAYATEYNSVTEGPVRDKALDNLVTAYTQVVKKGLTSGSNALDKLLSHYLSVLCVMEKVIDETILPEFDKVRKEVRLLDISYTNANNDVTMRNKDLIKEKELLATVTARWDARRLGSTTLIDSTALGIILGSCSAALLANGVSRVAYSFCELGINIGSHVAFCWREGLSWPTGLTFCSFMVSVFLFVMTMRSARLFTEQVDTLPFFSELIGDTTWQITKPTESQQEIKELAKVINKIRTVDAQLRALTRQWELGLISINLYVLFTEMITEGKVDEVANGASLAIVNTTTAAFNKLTRNLYNTIKYTSKTEMLMPVFAKIELLLETYNYMRLTQCALYASAFSMIYAYDGIKALFNFTTIAGAVQSILTGAISAIFVYQSLPIFVSLFLAISPHVIRYLRQTPPETKKNTRTNTRKAVATGTSPVSMIPGFRRMVFVTTFIFATMVHPYLVQAGIRSPSIGTYEDFVNGTSLMDILLLRSPPKETNTAVFTNWVESEYVRPMLLLHDTPHSAYKNVPEAEAKIASFEKLYTEAKRDVVRFEYPSADLRERYDQETMRASTIIDLLGIKAPVENIAAYLHDIGETVPEEPAFITPNKTELK